MKLINIKRDTITASTIITVLFMLKRKKAMAAEVKSDELRTATGVPTAVALDDEGQEGIRGRGEVSGLEELDFSQQRAIFIRYPGYDVFFAPTTGTLQKENGNIILKHY